MSGDRIDDGNSRPEAKPFWSVLHWQILAGLLLGIGLGAVLRQSSGEAPEGLAGSIVDVAAWLGALILRLLKMVVIPLTTLSIAAGTARLGGPLDRSDATRESSRTAAKLFGWTLSAFFLTSLCAALLGFLLATVFEPGAATGIVSEEVPLPRATEGASLTDVLLRVVPTNVVEALAKGDILALIFVSVCFGLGLHRVGGVAGQAVLSWLETVLEVVMVVTKGVLRVLPLGVFGLMTALVATEGFELFDQLGRYALVLVAGIAVHSLLVLPILAQVLGGRGTPVPRASVGTALLTAFSTSSSSATIPVTTTALTEKAGVSRDTASFVVPLGATVNMDATAMHQCVVAVFLCQVLGVEVTAGMAVTLVLVAVLASIGAAGIPSAGITLIFLVMQTLDVEGPQVDILIGMILSIDRPLDMLRTVGNVYSDAVVAVVVDRRMRAPDRTQKS